MISPQPLLLIILDGFGISQEKQGNPVAEAKLPAFEFLDKNFPVVGLQASGVAVGLPWGEAGNSEVGHLTIGAGRVIYQHLTRIIYSIYDGSFFKNESFLKAAEHVRVHNSSLHIAGLVSSGSVHSYLEHLYALLEFTKNAGVTSVFLHAFTDGKDAPPKEGAGFFKVLEEKIKKEWPQVKIASVVGRAYAMDRDEHWEKVRATYEMLTLGRGAFIKSSSSYLSEIYENGITDEFVEAALVVGEQGEPEGIIKENDALIFFNFREDSMREITRAFLEDNFDKFPRKKVINLVLVTMTEYQEEFSSLAAFPTLDVKWPLARILGEAGHRHLHIAETNKYAHVTYFLNGGTEKPFLGEERILVASASEVAHWDELPEMKAQEITEKVLENFNKYDVIIANYANADMVGHTGNYQACVRAVEALDEAVGKVMERVLASSAVMIVTADHGNIELKRNTITGEKLTEHSLNPVPFYLVGKEFRLKLARSDEEVRKKKSEVEGILTDISPTILELLSLKKPQEMSGKSLLDILKNPGSTF